MHLILIKWQNMFGKLLANMRMMITLAEKNLSVVHLSNIANSNQVKCTCSAEKTPVVI